MRTATEIMPGRRMLLRVALAAACLACAGNGVPAGSVESVQGQGIPELPPERVSPAWMDSVFAPANLLTDGRGSSRVPKNLLVVAFRPGSSVTAKSAAMQAVHGVVVGGYRLSADRYYYVTVPATGDSRSLGAFLDRMNAQPAVESATPLGLANVEGNPPATPVEDTTFPPIPPGLNLPTDHPLVTSYPGDSSLQLHRNITGLWFDSTATGALIRSVLARYHGQVIGGATVLEGDSLYVVAFPDPGAAYDSLQALVGRLRAEPGIRAVKTFPLHDRLRMRGSSDVQATDAAIPPIPLVYGLPRGDSVKTFSTPSSLDDKGYRQFFEIRFRGSITGPDVHAFLQEYRATIVGGSRVGGTYILRFPDPGLTYYKVTAFVTRLRGDLRVERAGAIPYSAVFSAPGEGLRADTTRPVLPDGFELPQGEGVRTVQAAGDSMTPFYDDLVMVEFVGSATGKSIRDLIADLQGTIVGGFPRANYYVIGIPPVPDYHTLLRIVQRLRATPIVAGAMAVSNGEAAGRPFVAPSGVGVGSQRSSVGPASSSNPVSDTTRPAIPNVRFDGADSAFVVASPTPGFSYFRRFAGVQFHDSVSGAGVRRFLHQYGLEVTGGFRMTGAYIVKFADPGPTFIDFKRWMDTLGADARVKFVVPLEHSTPPPDLR